MTELPSGTVTFLFTDLEGSTRLWEEHPDAMQDALARHDELLRDAVAAHGGVIVKGTGDGFHAAFATAHDAVDAAVDAQRSLTAEAWSDTGPLRVRMGVHTGEAQHRDGDYYGTALNRAARLMSVAHGGQVLISDTTERLLRDGSQGFELPDLGEHRLRDLAEALRIHQVCAPGLAREFPPLRSMDAFPENLPLQLTSFVGRDEELTTIVKILETSRLVTLTGVGGVGRRASRCRSPRKCSRDSATVCGCASSRPRATRYSCTRRWPPPSARASVRGVAGGEHRGVSAGS